MTNHHLKRITSRAVTATLVAALTGLGLGLVTPAASATERTHDGPQNRFQDRLQDRLQDSVNAIRRTGAVGVLARSTGPHGKRYATAGVADTATGRAVRPGDRFRIASSTKTFVAVTLLQLVGEGRVSLDDTVERRLPGVVDGNGNGNGNDGSDITVRQLLNHTSGLFN